MPTKSQKLPELECPRCGARINVARFLDVEDEGLMEGDIGVCRHCGEVLRYQEPEGAPCLIIVSEEETHALSIDLRWQIKEAQDRLSIDLSRLFAMRSNTAAA